MGEEARSKRLGRGLSALLGDNEVTLSQDTVRGLKHVPIEFLRPSALQPRKRFADDELDQLAQSIRSKGLLQPIIVRDDPAHPNSFEIVAGERRWRAAQKAQLHDVPVIVKALDDGQVLEIALIENLQRTDLNPIEEANAYVVLMERFGHRPEAVAETVGKSRSHIANTLRLLTLPQSIQAMIVEGQLSAGHARTLVGMENAEELASYLIKGELSVREAEEAARRYGKLKAGRRKRPASKKEKDADTRALEDNLTEALGLKVTLVAKSAESGEVHIAYKSLEQLDDICRRLKRP
jgi:ParB family chromosome partitioning protein